MNIAILGFDVEGRATYEYFAGQGHELTICDQKKDLDVPDGAASVLGESYLDDLDRFDLLVRTAGLQPNQILEKNPAVAGKITTHINEFFKASPTKNIIGVTGTKGKGTTSTLITKMLEASGRQLRLGGNIGLPPLTFLDELTADSWVVLELSSFQLIDLQYSPHIAVCLMVVPEHLNWHSDIHDYTSAKSHLFAHQTADDCAIYFAGEEMSRLIAADGQGQKIPYFTPPGAVVDNGTISVNGQQICKTGELKLLGAHNWQNVCAAVTAVCFALSELEGPSETHVEAIRSVLTSFTGLEHRLEFVAEVDGVKYYDDSFGTTPETAIVALEAFPGPKVVILGGSDKGASYDDLARAVTSNDVRKAILIGELAGRLQDTIENAGFKECVPGGDDMGAIVAHAREAAQPGDVVLLSTGCASFGMFENYKDRGDQFKKAVRALATTA